MNKLSLSFKIMAGFGLMIALLVAVGSVAWVSMQKTESTFATYKLFGEEVVVADEAATKLEAVRSNLADFIKSGSAESREAYEANLDEMSDHLATLKSMIQSPARLEQIAAMEADVITFSNACQEIVAAKVKRDNLLHGTLNVQGPELEHGLTSIMNASWETKDVESANSAANALRSLLLARLYVIKYLDTNAASEWERAQSELATTKRAVTALGTSLQDPALVQTAEEMAGKLTQYADAAVELVSTIEQRAQVIKDRLTPANEAILAKASSFKEELHAELEHLGVAIAANNQQAVTIIVGASVAAVIVGFLLAWGITRSITKPFQQIFRGLKSFSAAELSETGRAFNEVIEGLTRGGSQIEASSEQIASSASEQASGLEEISSSLEEMSSMTTQNAGNAQQADAMSTEAARASQQGQEAMRRMSDAITRIKGSSDETAKIIKTIDEIAFQTNLLALNAAVEAARAGEAGKGFAVVAEEVRSLAQRSAEAAKNTQALIDEARTNANNGVQVSEEVSALLLQITQQVGKVNELVREVNAATQEQASGIKQVNEAVSTIDSVTQSNAATTEELSGQASELNEMVNVLTRILNGNDNGQAHGRVHEGTLVGTAPAPKAALGRKAVPALHHKVAATAPKPVQKKKQAALPAPAGVAAENGHEADFDMF